MEFRMDEIFLQGTHPIILRTYVMRVAIRGGGYQ
jgi:hypothetical protein